MTLSPIPSTLADLVPDEPRWIDLQGLLLSGRCEIWSEEEPSHGFVALSLDFPFASVFATPGPKLIAAATAAGLSEASLSLFGDEWQLLATPENRSLIAETLPGWSSTGIVLHRRQQPTPPSAVGSGIEIRLLPEGLLASELRIDHVPQPSRHELSLDWVARRPMAVAVSNRRPVSFCYAAFTSGRFWDVAVETLAAYRRRGLAAACFEVLAAHMSESGKEPTWGAMLDNPASLALAAKLGFVRDGELDGWRRDRSRIKGTH